MLHKTAVALIAFASALFVSRIAHADTLVCGDALASAAEQHRWDELPSASASLYLAAEGCACGTPTWTGGPPATLGACSAACSFTDGSNDWGCGLFWLVCDPDIDPACDYDTFYAWTQAQADACNSCLVTTCSASVLACYLDH